MTIATGIILALLSIVDFLKKRIPVCAVVLLGMINLVFTFINKNEIWMLLFGLIPGCLALLISVATGGKMGKGDGLVLLGIGMGFGIETTFLVWWIALAFAACFSGVLLVSKRAGRKTELPFIPFIFAGYLVCIIFGG